MTRLLNVDAPRPGELYHIGVGKTKEDETTIEAHMPGALDFEQGIVQVNYQLWPLFQAIDLDHLLVCIDVAMSNSGRIIFSSKHSFMLSMAVNAFGYLLDLRGWDGISIPIVHAVG